MNLRHFFMVIALLAAMPLALNSCATEKTVGKTAAEILYKDAEDLVANKHYLQAIEYLNQLRSQHPYSFYATHAELMLADIYFMQENYIEAAAAYTLFRDMHPQHEKKIYVLYKIAESYYRQKPDTVDRDLDACYQAIKYYAELLQLYPRSEYTKDAVKKIKEMQSMIEGREIYVVKFYYKTKEYSAARYRCKQTIKEFDGLEVKKFCAEKIIDCSVKLKEEEQCFKDITWLKQNLSRDEFQAVQHFTDRCAKISKGETDGE